MTGKTAAGVVVFEVATLVARPFEVNVVEAETLGVNLRPPSKTPTRLRT